MVYFSLLVVISDWVICHLPVWLCFSVCACVCVSQFHTSLYCLLRVSSWVLGQWRGLAAREGFLPVCEVCVCFVICWCKHGYKSHLFFFKWQFNKCVVFRQTWSQPQPLHAPTLQRVEKPQGWGRMRGKPSIMLLQPLNTDVHIQYSERNTLLSQCFSPLIHACQLLFTVFLCTNPKMCFQMRLKEAHLVIWFWSPLCQKVSCSKIMRLCYVSSCWVCLPLLSSSLIWPEKLKVCRERTYQWQIITYYSSDDYHLSPVVVAITTCWLHVVQCFGYSVKHLPGGSGTNLSLLSLSCFKKKEKRQPDPVIMRNIWFQSRKRNRESKGGQGAARVQGLEDGLCNKVCLIDRLIDRAAIKKR